MTRAMLLKHLMKTSSVTRKAWRRNQDAVLRLALGRRFGKKRLLQYFEQLVNA